MFDQSRGDLSTQRAKVAFSKILARLKQEGANRQYPNLFEVIDQLDLVQEAFEPISKQDVTIQSL